MRSRDEHFADQDMYQDNPDPPYDKKAASKSRPMKRFGPQDFRFNDDDTAIRPESRVMTSPGSIGITTTALHYQTNTAKTVDCNACILSGRRLKCPLKRQ